MKRFLSWILCLSMLFALLPATAVAAMLDETGPAVLDNGYIRVEVSRKNGGFAVNTAEGDRIKKSDNNKKLLFHNGAYDTSFVSYRVDYGNNNVQDYLFGGTYGDATDPSHNGVTVTQEPNGDIISIWSVAQLTFTQTITLASEGNEHGMVSVKLNADNKGSTSVDIRARMLMDSYLGDRDFGYYQVSKENAETELVKTERIIKNASQNPQNFLALDDPYDPSVVAYSVSQATKPYQAAFGHWNNLAASLFDFEPKPELDFTTETNEYLTNDSAYALYYDMGSVAANKSGELLSYYGVYSNQKVSTASSVAVNVTAPIRLDLNEKKDDYTPLVSMGQADFAIDVNFQNFVSETAKPYTNVKLAVTRTGNLQSLDDQGLAIAGHDFEDMTPFVIPYAELPVGKMEKKTLYFAARPCSVAAYERITIGIYNGEIATNNKLGERTVYILLPGSDGSIPKVNFASMTPEVIFNEGTRHLFVTVTNPSMLDNRDHWNLFAYTSDKSDKKTSVKIPHDNIKIKEGVMDVAITDDIKMAVGSWFLQLEWTDAAVNAGLVGRSLEKQTAPALRFNVSNDKRYKNNAYGVLCVVESTVNARPQYRLMPFKDEADFKKFSDAKQYTEILLILRGEFIATKSVKPSDEPEHFTYYTAVSTKTLDKDRNYVVDNGISINGCMDFEGGNMTVYYEKYKDPDIYGDSPICVEFDGEILTSDARTSVWTGKAALSKIEQGTPTSLLPYDKDGKRNGNFTDETIKLIWPSVFGAGQDLAGMLFNMAYGELGVMNDGKSEVGRVLSFSASLDLSFASPQAGAEPKDTFWSKFTKFWQFYRHDASIYQYAYNAGSINKMLDLSTVDEGHSGEKQISGSVMVQDILFGCGRGFVGVHFNVEFAMANFIDALPKITGKLDVNTVNDWAFKFEGGMKLASFATEVKLSFKSHDDIPVPDDIYFYIGGFKPGINIDACGVVWITGGGGGISNLYDTIFLTQSVPPLKLILSVAFSIVQVLDGKATLSLGLTGVKMVGEDLKVFGTIDAIEKVMLGLEWYPGIDLRASISVNLLETIQGGGYIVLIGKDYNDWSFEMFARASLSIPPSVPVVGKMKILGVDLGLSDKKIWGALEVLMITLGVTYYWGEPGVDFTSGSKTQPTYPDLLGYEDVPIGYDAERDQVLYAHFGTNISEIRHADPVDLSGDIRLMGKGIQSDIGLMLHKFNLGEYSPTNKAAIVQISYDASSMDDANAKASTFKVNSQQDFMGTPYPMVLCNADSSNLATANANVSYDETTKKAILAFTVTQQADYNKDWYISTGESKADVVLYNVDTPPEVETVSGTVSNNDLNLTWSGSDLNELDKLSFYLTPSNDPDKTQDAVLLKALTEQNQITAGNATVALPANLPSGDYYIRTVYSKTDEINGTRYSDKTIKHVNTYTPDSCTVSMAPSGNLEYTVTVQETNDAKTTGYQATVYHEDGSPTEIVGLTHEKTANADTVFQIGGSYESEDEDGKPVMHGLTASTVYKVGVKPYQTVDSDSSGAPDSVVYGAEQFTQAIALPPCTTPTVEFKADKIPEQISHQVMRDTDNDPITDAVSVTTQRDTYTSQDITFTATLSEAATGTWKLDSASELTGLGKDAQDIAYNPMGTFTNTEKVSIPLKNIPDGRHTLTLVGKDSQGDTFRAATYFDVDTAPPRLMLTEPVNGGMFTKDGKVTIAGVTDADTRFTITSDGTIIGTALQTVTQLGGEAITPEGVFSFTVAIPDYNSAASRQLVIKAADAAGNSITKQVQVTHGGLADLNAVQVLVDKQILDNGNVPLLPVGETKKQLSLAGVRTDGTKFALAPEQVSWTCQAVQGNVQVSSDGVLTADPHAQAMVTGRFEVATGAYRTASLTVGASTGNATLAISSTLGGKVTGGGEYKPGDTVTLNAVPDSGYVFSHWTVVGATAGNLNATPLTFTMPDGNVTVTATFALPGGGGSGGGMVGDSSRIVKAGTIGVLDIPFGSDPNTIVPYYVDQNGNRVLVPISAVFDGKLFFLAPVDAQYAYTVNPVEFTDTIGIWAEQQIRFSAARHLFEGVGNHLFDPNGSMTRGMFVTVLHRMVGCPAPKAASDFKDVPKGIWYEKAVAWASENGIVEGYSNDMFAPDDLTTREQMCALFARYLRYAKYELPGQTQPRTFADEQDISAWAKDDMNLCHSIGLIQGRPGNLSAPRDNASRAEGTAVFARLIRTIIETKK